MRSGTKAEFVQAMSHHSEKRVMSTARTMDIIYTHCGVEIAWKTVLYKRGKPVSESYLVNPDFVR